MRPVLFYTDQYQFPLPEGHKFPLPKYRLVRELLEQTDQFDLRTAPLADRAAIERTHDPEYVRAFVEGDLAPAAMRRIGFPWSEQLVRRTLASVGGTMAAGQRALTDGFSGTLAGGTHHAFRAEGSGYCVFNDITVAIEALRAEWKVPRFAVIDLDVHQGDGTAQIFEDDPDVLTFSMHGGKNFPFRKQFGKLDVELDDGTSDEEYLRHLENALPAVSEFHPDFVFYQSGVDPLDSDRLGRLSVTMEGLRGRDERVFTFVRELCCPIVVTLGGGYSDPIERTAQAHAQTFRVAVEIFNTMGTKVPPESVEP
jgi:acetoin utilization deacetylase AcuC-like enzyme